MAETHMLWWRVLWIHQKAGEVTVTQAASGEADHAALGVREEDVIRRA